MDSKDLIENRGLRRHEGIGDFETTTKPMLRIKDIMRVTILLLFDESSFSGVAVKAYSQKGYLFYDFIFADLLIGIRKVINPIRY